MAITAGYDENNNVTSNAVSGTSSDSTTNVYDNFDRLTSSTQRGLTVSYSYDNNGNRLSVGTPSSSTGYSYDARNRVKTASTPLSTSATVGSLTTNLDYYLDGKKKTVTYPNGAKEEYEYFATNRVKTLTSSISGSVLSKFDYSYDRNGNRLTQDETRGARTINTVYSYDTLDRMTNFSVTESSATTKTDYTFEGYNRKTETTTKPGSTASTKTYTYDETDWLTQIADGTKTITYGYDNNGNTTLKADSSTPGNDLVFEYDARDKLTKTSKGVSLLGRYVYNANGYRISQLNSDRGDVDYYYDGTAVVEERNSGGLLAHYRYAGKLYSLTDGTSSQNYHQDALGSTTDLTDDTGATKASYFLNPWGMIVDSVGGSVNRRIFTGKEIDQNTGLINIGVRYYDPEMARFITQDTYLGEQGTPPSLHRYLYAYSNPTVFIDLEGYASEEAEKGLTDRASGWIGNKAKWLYGKVIGDNQVAIRKRVAEQTEEDPSQSIAAARQDADNLGKETEKQAAEMSKPFVESARDYVTFKGLAVIGGIVNAGKKAKQALTVEDATGKIGKKVKELEGGASDLYKNIKSTLSSETKVGRETTDLAVSGKPHTFRDILSQSEQAEFEVLKKKHPEWMPKDIDVQTTVRSVTENAEARAQFKGRGHHPHPLKFGGEPNPPDIIHTGERKVEGVMVKNPIHTEITNYWNKVLRRINSNKGSQ